MISVVTSALKGDNEVTLVGFGTFKAKNVKQEQEEILEQVNLFKLQLSVVPSLRLVKLLKMLLISIPN